MGGSRKGTEPSGERPAQPLLQVLPGPARLPPCQEWAPRRHTGRHFLSDRSVAFQLRKLSD